MREYTVIERSELPNAVQEFITKRFLPSNGEVVPADWMDECPEFQEWIARTAPDKDITDLLIWFCW